MRITQFAFRDLTSGWELEAMDCSRFNLLVGASGVGKTRILESLLDLQALAGGESISGISWRLEVSANDNAYVWEGLAHNTNQTPTLEERFFENGKLVAQRDGTAVHLNGKQVKFKLARHISLLDLLEEAPFDLLSHDLTRKVYLVPSEYGNRHVPFEAGNHPTDIDALRKSGVSDLVKLFLAVEGAPEVYALILDEVRAVFPGLEALIWDKDERHRVHFRMKERGVAETIPDVRLSAGMRKTLLTIAAVHLCAEGSVLLIDEFENSMGVNCIDILSEMTAGTRDLQFFVTSHHPYIINNVPVSDWRIVTRRGSQVRVRRAEEFRIGQSRHEAFMQLMQLDAFTEGVTTP